MKLLNAFSVGMVSFRVGFTVGSTFTEIPVALAKNMAKAAPLESCIGHADTAKMFEGLLGVPVSMNRNTVKMTVGEVALLGQYVGIRLPEGTTTLPEGAFIRWVIVSIVEAPVPAGFAELATGDMSRLDGVKIADEDFIRLVNVVRRATAESPTDKLVIGATAMEVAQRAAVDGLVTTDKITALGVLLAMGLLSGEIPII